MEYFFDPINKTIIFVWKQRLDLIAHKLEMCSQLVFTDKNKEIKRNHEKRTKCLSREQL